MRGTLSLALVACLAAGVAVAKPSLRDVEPVETGLLAISVADKIRRECGEISGRLLRAHGEMRALYDLARSRGFSDAEIEAYVTAESEKQRMRAKRDAYLAERGVVKSDPETYCAAGRAEIRSASRIGVLLRD